MQWLQDPNQSNLDNLAMQDAKLADSTTYKSNGTSFFFLIGLYYCALEVIKLL
jgi:hypothetical protein